MDSVGCGVAGYGIYRSTDPIQNFKIRVSLERIASTNGISCHRVTGDPTRLPQSQSASDEMEMSHFLSNESPVSEVEEYTFSWQEKVFSQKEYNLYSVESQCPGSLEKKYCRMVNRLKRRRRRGRPTNRLFTYTDDDHVFATKNTTMTSTNEGQMCLERDASTVRRRHIGSGATHEYERSPPQIDIVNYRPTDAQRKEWHRMATSVSVMHIMANVGVQKGATDEPQEVTLCTIRVASNGIVIVTPDFIAGQKPYKLETGNLGRDVYLYTLEHASNCITAEEKEQEARMFQECYSQHSAYLATQVGHEFQEISVDALRLHIFGEIVSAEDFEYDRLYINFFLELPGNWMTEGDGPLYGVTQTCATKCVGSKEIAHFSFPFAYQLICPMESLTNETTGNLPRWPQMFFQVMSLDSWNRFRTEGYGYINIPTVPGIQSCCVQTWRPIVQSLSSRLRRYFVGGSPELEDLSLAGITSAFQEKRLSKYGMQTESSGTVTVRIQTVQQCREFSSLEHQKHLMHLKKNLRLSTLQSSVVAVLEAFQQARQRMLAARQNIHI